VLFALSLACHGYAQKRGDKYVEQGRFADAAQSYERYLKRNEEDGKVREQLAFVYRKLRDYRNAEVQYRRAEEFVDLQPESHMHFAQILMKNGKRQEAAEQIKKYMVYAPESFVARLLLGSLKELDSWEVLPSSFEVQDVPGINGPYADFAPVALKEGLVFVTERDEDLVNENVSSFNNTPYLAVYLAAYTDDDFTNLDEVVPYLRNLNGDFHVGPVALDTARNEIFYSKVLPSLKRKDTTHLKTYQATIHNGKRLKKQSELFINGNDYSVTHPSLSKDGMTLFFTSDMPGGAGGLDIYYMKRDTAGGGWSDPQRLPDVVNTTLNEVFPYLYDENTLYFSSDGHTGYGGLDLFVSKRKNGKWQAPINLKTPINSPADDFGMTFRNESIGYFSSDRQGGKGKDDIYRFVQIADPEDQERVPVSGVFEYQDLPKEGVELVLMDEFDNVLKTTFTDSEGRFDFGQMPPNAKFKIEVTNVSPDTLDEAQMFLVNEQGQKVILLNRLSENEFAFSTLPREAIASLPLLEETDLDIGNFEIFGQLYTELPRDHYAGIELMVLDDEGNLITTVMTDSMGYYKIDSLSKNEHYVIKLADEDSELRASVFYDDGEALQNMTGEESSLFDFNGKPAEEERETIMNKIPARGYFSYDKEKVTDARLVLFDSNERILGATRTDLNGYFDFGLVAPASEHTVIIPDSLATILGLPSILIVDFEGNGALYAERLTLNTFRFTSLSFNGSVDELASGYDVSGQVYERLPGDYSELVEIVAYDEDGNVIEAVMTDAQGNFKFTKLSPDQNYIFKMKEEDASMLKVAFGDQDSASFDQLSDFVYERLQSDYLAKLAALESQDASEEKVVGQIYKKLPGDYGQGIKVYAVDDDGNVIDSTYTDASGSFEFKQLERQEDFVIQLAEVDDSELSIAFFDSKGFYDETVQLDSNNSYEYSKVILEAAALLDKPATRLKPFVYGQIYEKLPGDYGDGTRLVALDEEGNIVDIATLDAYGRFEFRRLDPDATYSLRLEEEQDTELKLALTDSTFSQLLQVAGVGKEDHVLFDLNNNSYQNQLAQAADAQPIAESPTVAPGPTIAPADVPVSDVTIFYKHREWTLSRQDSSSLIGLASGVLNSPKRFVNIESHSTTEETLLSRTYSTQRSVTVARLLFEQGIDLQRLYITNWEDLNPAYDCPPGVDCDQEELAKNRRTDVSVADSSSVPKEPDHIIYYDFNEWTLPTGSFGIMNRLVDTLRSNEELLLSVDTYTDFWGKYNTNLRISELRAINIRNYLTLRDIDPSRISVVWHGESAPVGESKIVYPVIVEKRKMNRRAEIRIINPTP